MTRVGVLGLGRMGSAMAHALHAGGHELVLWNRSPGPAAALAREFGASVAARPADVAADTSVAITMLSDGGAVRSVFEGTDGLIEGAHAGVILVDSSTVPPETIRAVEPAVRARGAGLLDAPVSGSVSLAMSGGLTLMVGGLETDLERARPALGSLSGRVFHLGSLGSGAAMKLAVNAVIFGLNEAVAEGLVLAESAGIDRAVAYDVLAASAVAAPFVGYKRAAFLEPESTPVAFSLDLAAKDLRLITALAAELGVGLPQAATNLRAIEDAAAAGGGDRDFSTVASRLRATVGVEGGTA